MGLLVVQVHAGRPFGPPRIYEVRDQRVGYVPARKLRILSESQRKIRGGKTKGKDIEKMSKGQPGGRFFSPKRESFGGFHPWLGDVFPCFPEF